MAYLTKAKEQNTQNEKTDQTKKNKVSVILFEFDCELHYHMQEMPKSSLPLPPKSGWDVFREEQYSNVVNEGFSGKDIASQLGEKWRKVSRLEKKKYYQKAKVIASFLNAVGSEPNDLERSSTMEKLESKSLLRRKSF